MERMKIIFLVAISILSSLTFVQAEEQKTYMNFLYRVELGDSFPSILRMYVKDNSVINKSTPLVQKNVKFNPHIKNWNQLPPGELISIYIPEDMLDLHKYKKKQSVVNTKNEEFKKVILAKTGPPVGFKGSLFYMASTGNFTQTAGSTSVGYKQNSLITLGVQGNYFPSNGLYSFSTSTYLSNFLPAEANLPPNSIKLPAEIGMNLYGDYLWKRPRISWHTGIDYEKFSSFNIEGIYNDQRIYLDRISVFYLTAGASHVLNFFERPIYLKASISKSVNSTTKTEYSGATNHDSLNGTKMLFYINYKISDRIFLHTLFKIHHMSGPSELTSKRIGVGFGYILF